ncbi:MAG: Rossmann-like and DUF2520 domain-containing protein [Bacteroidota bacterium]
MKSIVLFGTGNVAFHLFSAFSKSENFKIIQVYNHSAESLQLFEAKIPTTTKFSEVFPADIYLIAVKDDVICEIALNIKNTEALILHTSGGVPLTVFQDFEHAGVFYPLQTFSINKPVDFKNIPICIEAKNKSDLELLEQLAGSISDKVYHISSEQRKSLHVAAVFVSNFVNYLYTEGEVICKKNEIPFEILYPLIHETALKIESMSPKEAQTGPAKRNDVEVINSHLPLLKSEQQKIYQILTSSIQNLHGKKL